MQLSEKTKELFDAAMVEHHKSVKMIGEIRSIVLQKSEELKHVQKGTPQYLVYRAKFDALLELTNILDRETPKVEAALRDIKEKSQKGKLKDSDFENLAPTLKDANAAVQKAYTFVCEW